ncbi:MAG: bifunctional (p)ppGpp synthetase/guanosine-3',5'-bis(diphosphate) 3'-pyrophosphohydrolase [Desulfobulbaceae bacterium]|uniref:Bifunctional (P)ppGpp synthetase/guanosine-3',5'-bis(Diphosphate) 3'-pyrophosphohydrolase n=1 Tax=Candidatus Desulfatifera sulfidica TaxID=2841691 RepID=A0A8J6N944_9BACT|nr:bifunctional (p)ppGpp synthetase/guanosine-3',5'-bis(diphosphate) 3'-pyrophosphohydrolase [Candidatus Desulfatifera sulfidica]
MQQTPFDLELYRSQMRQLLEPDSDVDVFWRALDFAVEAHDDQWRRSGEAYIMHPCSVARILAEEMDVNHPEILAAALLHDTVEDVEEVTIELVGERYGSYVQAIVAGCTKVSHYSGDKQTQYKLIHRKIFSGAALRPEVILVKLADRLHNLRTLRSMPRHKRQKIAAETLDIYAPLATVLGLFSIKREMYDLALSFKFPKQGGKLQVQIDQLKEDPVALDIIAQIQEKLREAWLDGQVSIRTKGLWAYYDEKNRILRKKIENPFEILILVDDRQTCYRALGLLNEVFPPIPRTIRDFIANPKPTGYQGLHARANIRGQKFLFKIRNEDMARRAQRGLFKDWSSKSSKQRRFIREIQEMFDVLGSAEGGSYRDVIAASRRKEIYTYTPQGDLLHLPVRSTVLDFAFLVHTDIGRSCIGAMVANRKLRPEEILHDGDVVRIVRADKPVNFDQKMFDICQTPRARAELSKAFRVRRQTVALSIGRSILEQEMLRYGVPYALLEKPETVQVLSHFGASTLAQLHVLVGEGQVGLAALIKRIKQELYAGQSPLAEPTGAFNIIELNTLDPVSIKISACCKPSPTDKGLCGLLSERGLSVHSKNCAKFQGIKFQREDIVDVRWKLRETWVRKKQTLVILAATRQRMMMVAGVAPGAMKLCDLMILSKGPIPDPAWELIFEVPNLYDLRQVIKHFDKSGLPYEFVMEVE